MEIQVNFDTVFNRVINSEGGFQCDPKDHANWTGGKIKSGILLGTKFGISAMTYPDLDIPNLTLPQAREIYKRDWWDKFNLGIYGSLSFQMFDAAVNHGISKANQFLQKSVGVDSDGVIGEKTISAFQKKDKNDLVLLFIAERISFFVSVSTFSLYGSGWMSRMAMNLRYASDDN